jgi:hypothetical protein
VAFWAAATGKDLRQVERYPEYHEAELSEHIGRLTQRLASGESRVHLDIHTDDLDAEVSRLESLGAHLPSGGGQVLAHPLHGVVLSWR